jgi:putative heme-binding domain-containing protein
VGPELSGKAGATDAGGAGGARESLLQAVLQPSAQVQPRHYAWELRTEDGEVRVGFLEWTRGGRSRYVDTAGQAFELRDQDVLERRPLAKSIMPDGLALTLTDRELRDLLAYLESVAVGVE